MSASFTKARSFWPGADAPINNEPVVVVVNRQNFAFFATTTAAWLTWNCQVRGAYLVPGWLAATIARKSCNLRGATPAARA